MNAFKIFYYVLRELIFDNKDEYDFNSVKFNTRKFIITILMLLSIAMNAWMIYRFSSLLIIHLELVETCGSVTGKNVTGDPLD